ncbi:MAG: ribonuclease D [Abitibacteriaceae bacterium]|nr:ribonuclease D [Abditibacteriaceae bacterium]
MLINQQKNLQTFCEQLGNFGAPIAFDTEFISERRYAAKLCLVQIYAHKGQETIEALIDPLAVNLAPLLALIADNTHTKILHAGGQDLQILFQEFGCKAQHVFDTQIAAAFLGYGHQAGYVDLVRRAAGGPQLSKAQQFTDWAARPLSAAQMEYALDDVRYLPQLYTTLRRDLVARGRLAWAQTEFRRAEARAGDVLEPQELYRKFNLSGLSRRNLAVLRELAATRDRLARAIDKPPTFLVPDNVMLQMAKHPPKNLADLRSQRGMPGMAAEQARALLEAIAHAESLPPEQWPERNAQERPDPQVDVVANLLGLVAQVRAEEQSVSRAYLAPRDQLTALAAWWLRSSREHGDGQEQPGSHSKTKIDSRTPLDIPLLHDWRRELLGAELLELLAGRLAIALDANQPESVVRIVATKSEL